MKLEREGVLVMKLKWALMSVFITVLTVLTGCEPLLVLDPKGPQAERQAKDILLSIGIMSVHHHRSICYFNLCFN